MHMAMTDIADGGAPTHLRGEGWRGLFTPRMLILTAIVLMAFVLPQTAEFTRQALNDAFFQVTVFVGMTLAIVFGLEKAFSIDLGVVMGRAGRLQSFYAALLGATPGCGGAIIVVTQFTKGSLSFGSVVSVLIATMGDAAFLLLAREPLTAVLVVGVSLVAGTLTGWIVDAIHGEDFLRPRPKLGHDVIKPLNQPRVFKAMDMVWVVLVAASLPLSFAIAAQVDPNTWFSGLGVEGPLTYVGVAGVLLSLAVWALKPVWSDRGMHEPGQPLSRRIVDDTSFVTAWVAIAFLSYEAAVYVFGADVGAFFGDYRPFMPLMGMIVGLIPGCGPQIVVTTLYLAGAVPLSAQFANSIANDGDALFPAIALVPRAAFLATLYSAVPALIVGYGWMVLFE